VTKKLYARNVCKGCYLRIFHRATKWDFPHSKKIKAIVKPKKVKPKVIKVPAMLMKYLDKNRDK
jgi:hypothetical protein